MIPGVFVVTTKAEDNDLIVPIVIEWVTFEMCYQLHGCPPLTTHVAPSSEPPPLEVQPPSHTPPPQGMTLMLGEYE